MEKNRSKLILDPRVRESLPCHVSLAGDDDDNKRNLPIIKTFFIIIVTFYQLIISSVMRPCCRFYPTCSQYTLEAIQTHSLHKAFFLSLRRILCCHPWHPGGIDLVPPKKE